MLVLLRAVATLAISSKQDLHLSVSVEERNRRPSPKLDKFKQVIIPLIPETGLDTEQIWEILRLHGLPYGSIGSWTENCILDGLIYRKRLPRSKGKRLRWVYFKHED